MATVFYNGEFVDGLQPLLTAEDRSYRYGDGLFESLVAFDGSMPMLPYHYERLRHSCDILLMKLPAHFNFDWLKDTLTILLTKNAFTNARIRIQVSRASGGLYLPPSNQTEVLITCNSIPNNMFEWSSINATFSPYRVDMGVLSNLKTTSKIQYVMSALQAQKVGAEECFMFNIKGTLADAVSSNVFIVKDDMIITPALTNGGVNGVLRRYVISVLENEYKVVQADVLMNDIDEADEIFLTNAVKGIQSVAVAGSVVYSDAVTRRIFNKVNESISGIIANANLVK